VGYQQTQHLYVYVHNNPINLTDPSGEFFTPETLWDVAIVGLDLLLMFIDKINPCLTAEERETQLAWDRIALGFDLVAAATPIIPGGGGLAGRGTLALAEVVVRVPEVVRFGQVVAKAGQVGTHLALANEGTSGPSGKTYRDRFYKQYSNAPKYYDIHQRVPQEARRRGTLRPQIVDSIDNLRAVPKDVHAQINNEWRNFWKSNAKPNAHQVELFTRRIDQKYGQYSVDTTCVIRQPLQQGSGRLHGWALAVELMASSRFQSRESRGASSATTLTGAGSTVGPHDGGHRRRVA